MHFMFIHTHQSVSVQFQGENPTTFGEDGEPQREMTELMELYDVPPLQVGG